MSVKETQLFWIKAAGQVWGPYALARMARFPAEGRLSRETLVGARPEGPFGRAGDHPALQRMLGSEAGPPVAAAAAAPAGNHAEAGPAPEGRWLLAVLVGGEDGAASGPDAVRLGPGAFLLKTLESVAACRNRLTREGRGRGGLLVLEVDPLKSAWFNLPAGLDRDLRGP